MVNFLSSMGALFAKEPLPLWEHPEAIKQYPIQCSILETLAKFPKLTHQRIEIGEENPAHYLLVDTLYNFVKYTWECAMNQFRKELETSTDERARTLSQTLCDHFEKEFERLFEATKQMVDSWPQQKMEFLANLVRQELDHLGYDEYIFRLNWDMDKFYVTYARHLPYLAKMDYDEFLQLFLSLMSAVRYHPEARTLKECLILIQNAKLEQSNYQDFYLEDNSYSRVKNILPALEKLTISKSTERVMLPLQQILLITLREIRDEMEQSFGG